MPKAAGGGEVSVGVQYTLCAQHTGAAAVLLPGYRLLFVSLPDTNKCLWLGVRAGCRGHKLPGNTEYPSEQPCPGPRPDSEPWAQAAASLCSRLGLL